MPRHLLTPASIVILCVLCRCGHGPVDHPAHSLTKNFHEASTPLPRLDSHHWTRTIGRADLIQRRDHRSASFPLDAMEAADWAEGNRGNHLPPPEFWGW
jgi:hypothetical protein